MSEATVDVMEQRLREWGSWVAAGAGRGADGFPTKSVLHPEWQPPSSGSRPAMKVATRRDDRERQVHAVVCGLSKRMQHTLLVQYVLNLSLQDRLDRLGCAKATLFARVAAAKHAIALGLHH
jgi:hypothetical protein